MGQQVFQVGDLLLDLLVLVFDLLAFEGGQAAQLHIQDGLGLEIGQLEALHQAFFGRIGIRRFTDGLDDSIQVVQGDQTGLPGCGRGRGLCPARTGCGG